MIHENIIKHLHFRIAGLKQQLRDQDRILKDLEATIKEQDDLIKDLAIIVRVPKFKKGCVVSIHSIEGKYIVEDYMYEINYPIYNLRCVNDSSNIHTVLEVDIKDDE